MRHRRRRRMFIHISFLTTSIISSSISTVSSTIGFLSHVAAHSSPSKKSMMISRLYSASSADSACAECEVNISLARRANFVLKKPSRISTWLFWQGQKDSNSRPTVLETGTLPAELYPYIKDGFKNRPCFLVGL